MSAAQYLYIEMSWGGEAAGLLYCPVCGASLTEDDGCPHRLFVYFDEIEEFEHVSQEIRPLLEALGLNVAEDDGDDDDDDDACPRHPFTYFEETRESDDLAANVEPATKEEDTDESEELEDHDDEMPPPQRATAAIARRGVVCIHIGGDATGGGMAVCLDLAATGDEE